MLVNLGHRNRKTSWPSSEAVTCRQYWKFSPLHCSSKISSKTFLDYQTSDLKLTSSFILTTRFSTWEYYGSENYPSSVHFHLYVFTQPWKYLICWQWCRLKMWFYNQIPERYEFKPISENSEGRLLLCDLSLYLVTTCNSLRGGDILKNDLLCPETFRKNIHSQKSQTAKQCDGLGDRLLKRKQGVLTRVATSRQKKTHHPHLISNVAVLTFTVSHPSPRCQNLVQTLN